MVNGVNGSLGARVQCHVVSDENIVIVSVIILNQLTVVTIVLMLYLLIILRVAMLILVPVSISNIN